MWQYWWWVTGNHTPFVTFQSDSLTTYVPAEGFCTVAAISSRTSLRRDHFGLSSSKRSSKWRTGEGLYTYGSGHTHIPHIPHTHTTHTYHTYTTPTHTHTRAHARTHAHTVTPCAYTVTPVTKPHYTLTFCCDSCLVDTAVPVHGAITAALKHYSTWVMQHEVEACVGKDFFPWLTFLSLCPFCLYLTQTHASLLPTHLRQTGTILDYTKPYTYIIT